MTNDSYWLKSYPFLEFNEGASMARLNLKFEEYAYKIQVVDKVLTNPSHNNHFGHFIFDDFPKCFLDKINFNAAIQNPIATTPINKGIREMLTKIGYFNIITGQSFTQDNHKKAILLKATSYISHILQIQ